AWAPICRGWRVQAGSRSPLMSARCRFRATALCNRQYPMAKIMNCCLPFRGAIALAWKECGGKNSQDFRSPASVASVNSQPSTINLFEAVMFISVSAAETEGAGARLAEKIKAGDVLALVGDLGAGKTQFVKGLARGLGSNEAVTSPTFTLLHEYRGGRL